VRLLEFARAIVDRPRLLLLDEPTSGLSQKDAERLGRSMLEANRDLNCGFVLVEHDVGFVSNTCERLVVLHQGQKLADGETADVLKDQRVVEAYIGRQLEEG
jgi:branched-chain amino acid transport system ATP-binding protein